MLVVLFRGTRREGETGESAARVSTRRVPAPAGEARVWRDLVEAVVGGRRRERRAKGTMIEVEEYSMVKGGRESLCGVR